MPHYTFAISSLLTLYTYLFPVSPLNFHEMLDGQVVTVHARLRSTWIHGHPRSVLQTIEHVQTVHCAHALAGRTSCSTSNRHLASEFRTSLRLDPSRRVLQVFPPWYVENGKRKPMRRNQAKFSGVSRHVVSIQIRHKYHLTNCNRKRSGSRHQHRYLMTPCVLLMHHAYRRPPY